MHFTESVAGTHLVSKHNMSAAAHVGFITPVENQENCQCFGIAPGLLFLDPTEDPSEVAL